MGTLAAAAAAAGGGGGEEAVSKEESSSSASAFVEGGVQDACDDSCSICLEPFCHSDPATVTSCKHEYHVQCILEWAQRSKECPMCWQPLSLEDPSSQELLDAVEHEQPWKNLEEVPAFTNYAEFEERIMQHLAHQMARRGLLQNRPMTLPNNQVQPVGTANLQPAHEVQQIEANAASHNNLNGHARSQGAQRRHQSNLDQMQESQQSSDTSLVSESLKSRLLVASSKCKETLARTTRSFKERLRGRNNKTVDFRARAQEVSAEVVRQALKRISPESVEKEDVPTTSTSPTSHGGITESIRKSGARSDHLGGGNVVGISSQPPK